VALIGRLLPIFAGAALAFGSLNYGFIHDVQTGICVTAGLMVLSIAAVHLGPEKAVE
jgi:hypothetical protein